MIWFLIGTFFLLYLSCRDVHKLRYAWESIGGSFCSFLLDQALLTHSDHRAGLRDVGYGGGSSPGRDGDRPGEAAFAVRGSLPVHEATRTHLSTSGGHQLSGASSGFASYPVDNVHQARITWGVGKWGMKFGDDKRRDR